MFDSEEVAFKIKNTNKKIIFLVGDFENFSAYNFAIDNNYSYLDFNEFLLENKIDSSYFKGSDSIGSVKIKISIDDWTRKIAYKEQKGTIIIDGYNPSKIPDLLAKNLLMQELLYLAKNENRLNSTLVFVININYGSIDQQIPAKIIQNSAVILF